MAFVTNEERLIGCVLMDAVNVLPLIRDRITYSDFENSRLSNVYEAALGLLDDGKPTDPASIVREVPELSVDAAASLMEAVPDYKNALAIADAMLEDAARRKTLALCQATMDDGTSTADELQDRLQQGLDKLTQERDKRSSPVLGPTEVMREFWATLNPANTVNVISSGFQGLDKLLGRGFWPGSLYVLGARPGVGKTALAVCFANAVAVKQGGDVLFCSLEMSRAQITARRVANICGISTSRMADPSGLTDDDWQVVTATSAQLADHLYMPKSDAMSTQEIIFSARFVPDLRLLVVDYLGLIEPDDSNEIVCYQIKKITRQLKQFAMKQNIPVLLLSQLNRPVKGKPENERPTLSSLRDSGSIEQDADCVMLMHDPDPEADTPERREVVLDLAKNRNGPTGELRLAFFPGISKFVELEAQDDG